jgi:hypothetical protein
MRRNEVGGESDYPNPLTLVKVLVFLVDLLKHINDVTAETKQIDRSSTDSMIARECRFGSSQGDQT